jgi:hypothetical protein
MMQTLLVCVIGSVVTNGRHLLGLPLGSWYNQRKIAPALLECDQRGTQRLLSIRHRPVDISSNWVAKASLN